MNIPVQTSKSEPEPIPVRVRFIRVADRCDGCRAQAFVLVVVSDVDLLFCKHHFERYESRLREVATAVYDERDWINRAASPS